VGGEHAEDSAHPAAVVVDYLAFGLIVWVAPESGYLRGTGRPANAYYAAVRAPEPAARPRSRSPDHRYLAGLSPVPAASRCTG
jgi:hypothetical protein